jgi:2-hydroxychromene-2-carboxylate isomerase
MTPEFHFDFVSPNAYLVHRVLPQLERRTGVVFDYVPVSLGAIMTLAGNRPPMRAFAAVKGKTEYIKLEIRRFIAKHGLTKFAFNPHFPLDTKAVMRGALAAKRAGCLAPYAEAMFRAMWEDGARLDDPAVVAAVLEAAGLDAAALAAEAATPEVQAALEAASAASVARGTFGAPTFFVGDEIFFGKDALGDLEDEIVRQRG